jgi:amidophosphoribosyltransferase
VRDPNGVRPLVLGRLGEAYVLASETCALDIIGAAYVRDSLAFISIDGLYRAMGEPARDPAHPQFCDACFTGEYPIALPDHDQRATQPELTLLFEGRA